MNKQERYEAKEAIRKTRKQEETERLNALAEEIRWKGAIRLKRNPDEIKKAVQLANEIEKKPKNYTANTSVYGRQRLSI